MRLRLRSTIQLSENGHSFNDAFLRTGCSLTDRNSFSIPSGHRWCGLGGATSSDSLAACGLSCGSRRQGRRAQRSESSLITLSYSQSHPAPLNLHAYDPRSEQASFCLPMLVEHLTRPGCCEKSSPAPSHQKHGSATHTAKGTSLIVWNLIRISTIIIICPSWSSTARIYDKSSSKKPKPEGRTSILAPPPSYTAQISMVASSTQL